MQRRLFTVNADKLGFKQGRLVLAQFQGHRPEFIGNEALDFLFPVADELDRHRLHTARTKPLAHLAPEQRTKLVAHDTVQHASCLLCIHTIQIDWPRLLHCCLYSRLRDLIEYDTAVILSIESQKMRKMPGNRLSLAIRIGCKIDLIGIFGVLL